MSFIIEYTLSDPEYRIEFLKLLFFTVLGAVPAIIGILREHKLSVVIYKLKEIRKEDEYGF